MPYKSRIAALALASALAPSPVGASASTLVGTTTDASGVDDMLYNVTSIHPYSSTIPSFQENAAGASDAAAELGTASNDLTVLWALRLRSILMGQTP